MVLGHDVAQVRHRRAHEARFCKVDEETVGDEDAQRLIKGGEVVVDNFAVGVALGLDENVVDVAADRGRVDHVVENVVDDLLQLGGRVDEAHCHARDGEIAPRRRHCAEQLRVGIEADLVKRLLQVHGGVHVVARGGLERGGDGRKIDVLLVCRRVERGEVPAEAVVVGAWFASSDQRREPDRVLVGSQVADDALLQSVVDELGDLVKNTRIDWAAAGADRLRARLQLDGGDVFGG